MKYKYNDQWHDIHFKVSDTLPIGTIVPFGSDAIPGGWLLCDGRAVSRTDYKILFAIIGTAYGEGDGSTTFNLPNLKGRTLVGAGIGEDDNEESKTFTLAESAGEYNHQLIVDELASHTHTLNRRGGWGSTSTHTTILNEHTSNSWEDLVAQATGGDQPHNNLQPYLVVNYIIKAEGVVGAGTECDTLPIGAIVDYDGESVPEGYEIVANPTYSTTETKTGETWIDNKPIYRKVITGTITSSSTSNETVLLVDNNIKEMVGMRGVINYGDNAGNRQQIGAYANANYYSLLQYNNSLHTVYFYGANNYVGKTATCIIEYTKTTD